MALLSHPVRGAAMWSGPAAVEMAGRLVGPADVAIRPGRQEATFRWGAGLRITGKVTDKGGRPVAGARVSAFEGFAAGNGVKTDLEGRYALEAGFVEGATFVLVEADGYVQVEASPTERPKDGVTEVVVDVTLEQAAVLSGRVVDPLGTPVAGARVRLLLGEAALGRFSLLMFQPVEGLSGEADGSSSTRSRRARAGPCRRATPATSTPPRSPWTWRAAPRPRSRTSC